MATRATVKFIGIESYGEAERTLAQIYQHNDGYPLVHGEFEGGMVEVIAAGLRKVPDGRPLGTVAAFVAAALIESGREPRFEPADIEYGDTEFEYEVRRARHSGSGFAIKVIDIRRRVCGESADIELAGFAEDDSEAAAA